MGLGFLDGQLTTGGVCGAGEQRLVVGAHDTGVGDDEVNVAGAGGDVRGGGFEGTFDSYVALERDDSTLVVGRRAGAGVDGLRGGGEFVETPAEDIDRGAVAR